MKKCFIVVLLIGFIGIGIIPASAAEELPLLADEWPPYVSKNMDGYGFCTEIVTAAVQEMGMTPKYSFVPWKRGLFMTKAGEAFAIFPAAVTSDRQKEYDFSDMILENRSVFFYNRQNMKQPPSWTNPEDLKPYRIGGVSGYSYVSAFAEAGLKVDYSPTEEANLKMLYAQRVNLMITDERVGWYLIGQMYPNERDLFGVLEKPFITGNSHLMVSRTYPNARQLTDRFNQALQRIKENGTFKKILTKHGILLP
jgi:polar amino acid transport system substrate-binding protein